MLNNKNKNNNFKKSKLSLWASKEIEKTINKNSENIKE